MELLPLSLYPDVVLGRWLQGDEEFFRLIAVDVDRKRARGKAGMLKPQYIGARASEGDRELSEAIGHDGRRNANHPDPSVWQWKKSLIRSNRAEQALAIAENRDI